MWPRSSLLRSSFATDIDIDPFNIIDINGRRYHEWFVKIMRCNQACDVRCGSLATRAQIPVWCFVSPRLTTITFPSICVLFRDKVQNYKVSFLRSIILLLSSWQNNCVTLWWHLSECILSIYYVEGSLSGFRFRFRYNFRSLDHHSEAILIANYSKVP